MSDQSGGGLRRRFHLLWNRPEGREAVIDGVRAIAVLWVILLHVFFFHFGTFPDQVLAVFNGAATKWILQGLLGVDLFFVISGYLIGTILLREHRASGSISMRRFYARRFLRLIPVYCVVMLLAAPLLQDIPPTAFLKEVSPSGNVEYAWANLLYVNNLLSIEHQYMPWCWSLAIEEQFYLIAPIFLLLVLGRGRRALLWMGLLLLASSAIRYGVCVTNEFVPPLEARPSEAEWTKQFDVIYDKLHVRFGGLLAGMMGAYVALHHLEQLKRWIGGPVRSTVILACCAFVFVLVACTAFTAPTFADVDPTLSQLFFAVHRDLFSVAVIVGILVACHGQGRFADGLARLLSARVLYPVAQLSYTAYLVHEVVMIWLYPMLAPALTDAGFSATATIAVDGVVAVIVTAAVCVVLFLFVEMPSMEWRGSARFRRLSGERAAP
ncbi:MAG: acyltransferase [Planctomycetota bacterium]|nr:acyltransferase [Planctomycetota bacterium]